METIIIILLPHTINVSNLAEILYGSEPLTFQKFL